MEKKKGLIVTLLIIAILLVSSSAFSQTPIKWRGQSAYPTAPGVAPFPELAGSQNSGPFFAKWLKERTKGQLLLDVAQQGSIMPVTQSFTAVSRGVIDFVGLYYGAFHSGQMPEANIEVGLPFAWETMSEAWDGLYNRKLADEFKKIYAENNIYWIPYICNILYGFGTTFPVPDVESLKGKKIRAGGVYGDVVKALGASPVLLPMGEVYMALKLGTIDGTIMSLDSVETAKMAEVWKYYVTSPNLNTIVGSLLINMDSFNKLPDNIKALIENEAPLALLGHAVSNEPYEIYLANKYAKQLPFNLVRWPDSEAVKMRKIGYSVWDQVAAKSPRCAKLVEMVRSQMRDLGKM